MQYCYALFRVKNEKITISLEVHGIFSAISIISTLYCISYFHPTILKFDHPVQCTESHYECNCGSPAKAMAGRYCETFGKPW